MLHQQLSLPMDRPQFRRANSYIFIDDLNKGPLLNVHEGISSQGDYVS